MKRKLFSGWVARHPDPAVRDAATNSIMMCDDLRKKWAADNDWEYDIYLDADFFNWPENVVQEFLSMEQVHVGTLSDYARLLHTRTLLDQGYDQAGWIDADIIPHTKFEITDDVLDSDLVCISQMNITFGAKRDPRWKRGGKLHEYTNGILIFRNTPESRKALDDYIEYCEKFLQNGESLPNWYHLGPEFLCNYAAQNPTLSISQIHGLASIRKTTAGAITREGSDAALEFYRVVDQGYQDEYGSRFGFINLSPNANLRNLEQFTTASLEGLVKFVESEF